MKTSDDLLKELSDGKPYRRYKEGLENKRTEKQAKDAAASNQSDKQDDHIRAETTRFRILFAKKREEEDRKKREESKTDKRKASNSMKLTDLELKRLKRAENKEKREDKRQKTEERLSSLYNLD